MCQICKRIWHIREIDMMVNMTIKSYSMNNLHIIFFYIFSVDVIIMDVFINNPLQAMVHPPWLLQGSCVKITSRAQSSLLRTLQKAVCRSFSACPQWVSISSLWWRNVATYLFPSLLTPQTSMQTPL